VEEKPAGAPVLASNILESQRGCHVMPVVYVLYTSQAGLEGSSLTVHRAASAPPSS
jgi:hypothetical protein